jgi:hypothetical protein
MKKILILSFLFMLKIYAGDDIGNGGDAVVCYQNNQRVSARLLDYFEMEIYGKKANISDSSDIISSAQNAIFPLKKLDSNGHEFLKKTISVFLEKAVFLSNIDLVDIPDSDHSIIPKGCKIEQLSVMNIDHPTGRPKYTLNADIWKLLDHSDRAGLILHESVYEMLLKKGHQNSRMARIFNEYLATDYFKEMDMKTFFKTYQALKVPTLYHSPVNCTLDLNEDYTFLDGMLYSAHILKREYVYGKIAGKTYFHKNGKINSTQLISISKFYSGEEWEEEYGAIRFQPNLGRVSYFSHGGLQSVHVKDSYSRVGSVNSKGKGELVFHDLGKDYAWIAKLKSSKVESHKFYLDRSSEAILLACGALPLGHYCPEYYLSGALKQATIHENYQIVYGGTEFILPKYAMLNFEDEEKNLKIDLYDSRGVENFKFGKEKAQKIPFIMGAIQFKEGKVTCLEHASSTRSIYDNLFIRVQNKLIEFKNLHKPYCFYPNSNYKSGGRLINDTLLINTKGKEQLYQKGSYLNFDENELVIEL